MGQAEFNTFCKSLPHTTHVVHWGGADVWKVGGKVFVVGGLGRTREKRGITFKCTPLSYEMLKEMPCCRPAPYLASRGMKWIQRTSGKSLSDKALKDYLRESHRLVTLGLPKKVQAELGLGDAPRGKKSASVKPAAKSKIKSKSTSKTAQRRTLRGKP